MNDVEIIDLHAQSCPATYAELMAKYTAVCKERDELKKQLHRALFAISFYGDKVSDGICRINNLPCCECKPCKVCESFVSREEDNNG